MSIAVLVLPFASLVTLMTADTGIHILKSAPGSVVMALTGWPSLMDPVRASLLLTCMGST